MTPFNACCSLAATLAMCRVARPEQRYAAARARIAEQPRLAVDTQLVARIGDVQVAHRELADAVDGREEYFPALLHGQALWLVGEVRAFRIENRVVVAAAQFQLYFAAHRL